jgi:sulfate transport system permease protein
MTLSPKARYLLRFLALAYVSVLLIVPVGLILLRTFQPGLSQFFAWISTPAAISALNLSVLVVAIVVPLNVVFGIPTALMLARNRFRGKGVLQAIIDLPFAVSPVVVGLALLLVYGRTGWFGDWLAQNGWRVVFSFPAMLLATIFVSLPFVVRETIPVLREVGTDQEQAAETLGAGPLQTFWRVTLPAIRWGVAYGVVLTVARALGEFGAVSVVSGHIAGQTETLTLHVQDRFEAFDLTGAYAASLVLALLALITLLSMNVLRRKEAV